MRSKVDANEATPNSEVAQDPEPSYEACHKVLETVELLEMILLSLHGSQDMFAEANHPLGEAVSSTTWYDNRSWKARSVKCPIEYEYTQVDARRNMTTLLLSQRVNRMFNDTIQGSVKLQKALWFIELEESRDHRRCTFSETKSRINPLFFERNDTTPISVESLQGTDGYFPRAPCKSIAVELKIKMKNDWTGQPQSWSRMLIAQSVDQTCVPMELDWPDIEYKFLHGDPYFTNLCASETAADVFELAEDLAYEDYLDLLEDNMNMEELSKEVQKLKAKGGYLYKIAKS